MLSACAALVQRHDPERFITVLFAPAARRETLWTLYAVNHELARAREVASVPLLALIRLQWWREVVEGADRRHPVALALRTELDAGRLIPDAITAMIAARELEAEDTLTEAQWCAYLTDAAGMVMREAGRVLGAETELAALSRAGAGCGAVGLIRNRATHQSASRWSNPPGWDAGQTMQQARTLLGPCRHWSAAAIPAALPLVHARRWLRVRRPPFTATAAPWVWAAALRRWT